MIIVLAALILLFVPAGAWAQTCNTTSIECTSKNSTSAVINVPDAAEANTKTLTHVVTEVNTEWNSKIVANIVILPDFLGNTKQLVHVVVIPGTATAATMPVSSPRTHP